MSKIISCLLRIVQAVLKVFVPVVPGNDTYFYPCSEYLKQKKTDCKKLQSAVNLNMITLKIPYIIRRISVRGLPRRQLSLSEASRSRSINCRSHI